MQPCHLLFAWLKIIERCTDRRQDRLLLLVLALMQEVFSLFSSARLFVKILPKVNAQTNYTSCDSYH